VFHDLGFTSADINAIYKTIATVLLMGQIQFDDSKFDESGIPCSIANKNILGDIAFLLGIENLEEFEAEIVNKPKGPHEVVRAPLKIEDCNDARDSLAKAIYNNLFCWIVKRTNLTILP
jgi:myosin heavy subunit